MVIRNLPQLSQTGKVRVAPYFVIVRKPRAKLKKDGSLNPSEETTLCSLFRTTMIISVLAIGVWAASLGVAVPTAPEKLNSGPRSSLRSLAQLDEDLGSLILIAKAQDDVNDPEDLTVSATILNTGNTTLKILNDPNGECTANP
jgi:hypothetical protein